MGKTAQPLSYSANLVHQHDRQRFLLALFVPPSQREAFFALYALNIELAQVGQKVTEEILLAIRYAWWQEQIQKLYDGKAPGQPVLQALFPIVEAGHLSYDVLRPLLDAYQSHSISLEAADRALEAISLALVRSLCPKVEPKWRKASAVVSAHRARYQNTRNGWLSLKLLIA